LTVAESGLSRRLTTKTSAHRERDGVIPPPGERGFSPLIITLMMIIVVFDWNYDFGVSTFDSTASGEYP
jgi:hypothetical protein